MRRFEFIRPAWPVLITLAFLAVLVAAFSTFNLWIAVAEEHLGLASWAQAFGSVAAIAAAIWVADRANRQVALAAKAESVRMIELVCGIGFQLADLVDESWQDLQAGEMLPQYNFDHILPLFEGFPLDKYPSAEMAMILGGLHRLVRAYRDQYSAFDSARVSATGHAEILGVAIQEPALPDALPRLKAKIDDHYRLLIEAGQNLLDALPGDRIVLPMDSDQPRSEVSAELHSAPNCGG